MEFKITIALDKATRDMIDKVSEKVTINLGSMTAETKREPYQSIPTMQQPTPEQPSQVAPTPEQPVQEPQPIAEPKLVSHASTPMQPTHDPLTNQAIPTAPVATQAPTYTPQQLAIAATQLMDAGRQQEVLALLSKFGVQALTQLQPEQFGTFATELRTMGAKI